MDDLLILFAVVILTSVTLFLLWFFSESLQNDNFKVYLSGKIDKYYYKTKVLKLFYIRFDFSYYQSVEDIKYFIKSKRKKKDTFITFLK